MLFHSRIAQASATDLFAVEGVARTVVTTLSRPSPIWPTVTSADRCCRAGAGLGGREGGGEGAQLSGLDRDGAAGSCVGGEGDRAGHQGEAACRARPVADTLTFGRWSTSRVFECAASSQEQAGGCPGSASFPRTAACEERASSARLVAMR
ncbi:hypothetical protein [Rhodococcus sp. NPDC003348]